MKKTLLTFAVLATALTSAAQTLPQNGEAGKYLYQVDEYKPAPGQFTNALPQATAEDTPATIAQRLTEAYQSNHNTMITLGAWGGYVTFRFDHSVYNTDGADIYIGGNAFTNSAEPGIVMVAQDADHDGQPDEWFELAGSCDTAAVKPVYNYSLTYYYDPMQNVRWADNQGNTGTVDRNSFHQQEYFPLWLASADSITFTGTRLPDNVAKNGNTFILPAYDWGYTDNKANSDSVANSFDISNAVDSNRNPVALKYVDFVRVYSAMNQKAGWLGETSTEFTGAEDCHLQASVHGAYGDLHADSIASFEDFINPMTGEALADDGYYNGETDQEFFFSSASYTFPVTNSYGGAAWNGFAASNRTETTFDMASITPDQFNVTSGSGYAGSKIFTIVYPDMYSATEGNGAGIEDASGSSFKARGMYVNNTAYVVNSIVNGGAYEGAPFTDGDWLKATAWGTHADGTRDSVNFYLADYTSPDAQLHYYLKDWTYVDLSKLGDVTKISFWITGSRTGDWGLNTPGYFAIDNFGDIYDGQSAIAKSESAAPIATGIKYAHKASGKNAVEGIYSIDGKRLNNFVHGINIIRMSDGSVRKVVR